MYGLGFSRRMRAGTRAGLGVLLASVGIAATQLAGVAAATIVGSPPQITITVPLDGGVYARGASLVADFACTDQDGPTEVIGCSGTVADGAAIDASTPGTKSFMVEAEDRDGNTSSKTVSYTIVDESPPAISVSVPNEDGSTRLRLNQVIGAAYGCTDADGVQDVAFCVGTVALGAPLPTGVAGNAIFTVNAADLAGNAAQKNVPYVVDASPPAITIATPAQGVRLRAGQVVAADYACTDPDDTANPLFVDVQSCAGPVADGAAINTSTPGSNSFTVDGDDRAGNTASKTVTYVVDASAPELSITAPVDGSRLHQGQVVLADYACTDEDGPADVRGCSGTAGDGAPIDTSTPGSKSFTIESEDRAGNTSSKTVHYFVDASAPQISITAPVDGGSYARGASVIADYGCTDADGPADVTGCAGTVAAGAAIDTSTTGTKSFTVAAVDQVGNTSSKTVSYTIVDESPPPTPTTAGLPSITPPASMLPSMTPPTPTPTAAPATLGPPRPGDGGTVALKFTIPSSGALVVSATTTTSGAARAVTYAKANRAVKAGVVLITLKPTMAAKRLLAYRKQLKVKIRAVFTPAASGQATVLTRSTTVKAKR